MAEVNDPTGESPTDADRRGARPVDTTADAERGPDAADDATTRRYDAVETEPADPAARPAAVAREPREPAVAPEDRAADPEPAAGRTETLPAAERGTTEPDTRAAQRPIEPADQLAPPPPRARGNRVVGTAWVLLAAGVFQVLFFAANALVALVFGGAAAVVPQLQSIAGTALAWLPVLLFFLLFELTVLLVNRAGRFTYVVMSLIVGAAVYIATVLLFSLIVRHALGDANTLAQTFLNWEFILIGLVARETMLWTGLAIGSRGIRVRRRNREARKRYEQELADGRA